MLRHFGSFFLAPHDGSFDFFTSVMGVCFSKVIFQTASSVRPCPRPLDSVGGFSYTFAPISYTLLQSVGDGCGPAHLLHPKGPSPTPEETEGTTRAKVF